MMTIKKIAFVIIATTTIQSATGQAKKLSYGVSNMTTAGLNAPALNATYFFGLSKKKTSRLQLGVGARYTNVRGGYCKDYLTAPAELTSGKTGPGVLFADQINANLDSISLDKTRIGAINILGAINYRINSKLNVEFNIDLVGISFGKEQNVFLRDAAGVDQTISFDKAKPTSTNLTLVSDNDKGTLNSEFVFSYRINKNWKAKLGPNFLFSEYTLSKANYTNLQGVNVANDRFRNKALGIGYGVIYNF
jgi:hypothetical protein